MIRLQSALRAFAILLPLAFMSGCEKPTPQSLYGLWQESRSSDYLIDFWEDGTVVTTVESNKVASGKWGALQDGSIELVVLNRKERPPAELRIVFKKMRFLGPELHLTSDEGTSRLIKKAAHALNSDEAIVGKWHNIGNGAEKMEFFKSGTLVLTTSNETMSGDFSFLNNNTIRVNYGGIAALAGPVIARVSIAGDDMTWISTEGVICLWKRDL